MNSSIMPAILAAALLALATPAVADETSGEGPTPEQAQAYRDAQACVIVLRTAGDEEDLRMADLALAKAKELAPVNDDETDEMFAKSMTDWEQILAMASVEESRQFLASCRETWSN
jgi:hypothetical protein